MTQNLKKALEEFKKRKILVIGDILLDKFLWGSIKRVNPEQPAAPLVKIIKENFALGGAANVANNILSLGATCCLYGVIGEDSNGERIKKLCEEKGISLKYFYNKKPTIIKQRVMAHGQQIARLDFGEEKLEKLGEEIQGQILDSLRKEINNFDFIILSDYDKFFFDENLSREIISLANSNNIPTLVDPKPENVDFFRNCTLICPNKHEAEKITQIKYSNGENTLTKMGEILSERVNSKYVVMTCGKDGMFSYDKDRRKSLFIETKAREIANVTGAGDTFAATLALGMASKLNIEDSAKLANYAAGIVVGKVGTSVTTTEEIKEYLEK